MSLRKPIIKVTKECDCFPNTCAGKHNKTGQRNVLNCNKCRGTGKIDVKRNNKDFKKYYIENLEEVIEYWTKLYRHKNNEAQEYLKKVSEYSKELDKVVNG